MEQEMYKHLINVAKENLIKSKKLIPILFLEQRDNKIIVTNLPFENKTKEEIIKQINEELQTGKYKSYLFIAESWMLKIDKHPTKNNLKRKECITIAYKEDTGNKLLVAIPFKRIKNKIVFEDEVISEKYTGAFDFWI